MWSDWLVFCDYGFSLSAFWYLLATTTTLLGFLLPWTWGISSRCSSKAQPLLLTLDEVAPPDLERGVVPLGPPAPSQWLLLGRGVAPLGHHSDLGRGVAPLSHASVLMCVEGHRKFCFISGGTPSFHILLFQWQMFLANWWVITLFFVFDFHHSVHILKQSLIMAALNQHTFSGQTALWNHVAFH